MQAIIDGLQSEEGGEIPADVDVEEIDGSDYVVWTAHTKTQTNNETLPGQMEISFDGNLPEAETTTATTPSVKTTPTPTPQNITQLRKNTPQGIYSICLRLIWTGR